MIKLYKRLFSFIPKCNSLISTIDKETIPYEISSYIQNHSTKLFTQKPQLLCILLIK